MSVSSGRTDLVVTQRRSEILVPPAEAKCARSGVAQRAERAELLGT